VALLFCYLSVSTIASALTSSKSRITTALFSQLEPRRRQADTRRAGLLPPSSSLALGLWRMCTLYLVFKEPRLPPTVGSGSIQRVRLVGIRPTDWLSLLLRWCPSDEPYNFTRDDLALSTPCAPFSPPVETVCCRAQEGRGWLDVFDRRHRVKRVSRYYGARSTLSTRHDTNVSNATHPSRGSRFP
jgi:hypothetical protein